MTHVHAPVIKPRAEIARQAREAHPVLAVKRALITAVFAFFTAIGWTAGTIVFVTLFSIFWTFHSTKWCFMSMKMGWDIGVHNQMVPKKPE